MRVELNLYATLAELMPDKTVKEPWIVEMEEGAVVEELLGSASVPLKSAKLVFINGVHADKDSVLKDGDRVGVFPPIGGG